MQANFYKEKIEELYDLFPISSPPFPSNNPHDLLINYADSEEEMHDYARSLLGLTGQRSIVNFGMIVETIYFLRRPRDFLIFFLL